MAQCKHDLCGAQTEGERNGERLDTMLTFYLIMFAHMNVRSYGEDSAHMLRGRARGEVIGMTPVVRVALPAVEKPCEQTSCADRPACDSAISTTDSSPPPSPAPEDERQRCCPTARLPYRKEPTMPGRLSLLLLAAALVGVCSVTGSEWAGKGSPMWSDERSRSGRACSRVGTCPPPACMYGPRQRRTIMSYRSIRSDRAPAMRVVLRCIGLVSSTQ